MCAVFGYEAEEHILQTKDGYLLCLHRICRKKGEPYAVVGSNTRHRIATQTSRVFAPWTTDEFGGVGLPD